MNGYDFDDTIFRGNSFRRFYLYCLIRFPYIVVLAPLQLVAFLLKIIGIIDENAFLTVASLFMPLVPCRRLLKRFWDKNIKRIKPFYLAQKRSDDVIVSASPYFLVAEACSRLGVECIATDISPSARLHGRHCYADEKVKAFIARHDVSALEAFYSDSLSDTPMFKAAQRGYLVKGEKITLAYQSGVLQDTKHNIKHIR